MSDFSVDTHRLEELESEIGGAVYLKLNAEIKKEINEIVTKYCSSAETSIEFENDSMIVNVYLNHEIGSDTKNSISRAIRDEFKGEIKISFTVVK